MSLSELYQQLRSLGYPCAYHHFEEGRSPKPPFLLYLVTESKNVGADNLTYHKELSVAIEIYTSKKNIDLERQVEGLLDVHLLYFDKVESYITSEKLYLISYSITIKGE